MPESLTTPQPPPAELSAEEIEWIDRSLIDESMRTPVMFFFTTALTWLLAATVLGVVVWTVAVTASGRLPSK